jgi:hypothetical protein
VNLLANVSLALQAFITLFLALHDWIPLGSLNDIKAVQGADSRTRLVIVTFVSALPSAIGLAASIVHFGEPYPDWLWVWLLVTYGLLFAGLLRAWWIPYLLVPEPARAARYRAMFGTTHSFLPERNGIRPNTLHVLFHLATVALLVVLALMSIGPI